MSTIAEQANSLLDFSGKLDIQLLDNVINCMYKGHGQQVGGYCNINPPFHHHTMAMLVAWLYLCCWQYFIARFSIECFNS